MMKSTNFVTVILLLCTFALSGGCQKFDGYDFYSPEIKTEFGSVQAKLYGEKEDWLFYAKQAEPYALILRFNFDNQLPDLIEIKSINIIQSSNQKVLYQNEAISVKVEENTNKKYVYFKLKNVLRNYVETNLEINLIIKEKGKDKSSHSIQIPFSKDYKSFWQSLLSA